jgi:hypothetical protein
LAGACFVQGLLRTVQSHIHGRYNEYFFRRFLCLTAKLLRLFFYSKALERSAKVVNLSSMATAARAFKPYGSPPRFNLDEFKDTFELWHCQWKIFLALSTIDTVLEKDEHSLALLV